MSSQAEFVRSVAYGLFGIHSQSAGTNADASQTPSYDHGEGKRPARQYEPRSLEAPSGSFVEIANEMDAKDAVSDQIGRVPEVRGHLLQVFYQLLVLLQTPRYQTFSSLLYWRNNGTDDLDEAEVLCADILVGLREFDKRDVTVLSAVEALAQDFQQRFRIAGSPTSKFCRAAIHLRPIVTIFGTPANPQPSGYSLEIKVLGGSHSRHKAASQWTKAIEVVKSAVRTTQA